MKVIIYLDNYDEDTCFFPTIILSSDVNSQMLTYFQVDCCKYRGIPAEADIATPFSPISPVNYAARIRDVTWTHPLKWGKHLNHV